MYQPTKAEVAQQWANTTQHHELIATARAALGDVNQFISLGKNGIQISAKPSARAWRLLDAKTCTCQDFREAPIRFTYIGKPTDLITPKPRPEVFCIHTLIWHGYTRILRTYFQLLKPNLPSRLAEHFFIAGEYHPRSNQQYAEFAEWLVTNAAITATATAFLVAEAASKEQSANVKRIPLYRKNAICLTKDQQSSSSPSSQSSSPPSPSDDKMTELPTSNTISNGAVSAPTTSQPSVLPQARPPSPSRTATN